MCQKVRIGTSGEVKRDEAEYCLCEVLDNMESL